MPLTENLNYLQPSGFRVVIDRTRFANLAFFVQSVSHPNITTNAAEVQYRQHQAVPQIGDTYSYGELSMNVILDEDMNSYLEIYNWIKSNVDNEVTDTSKSDILLTILSSKNNLNKQIKYVDAFPTDLGAIQFESNVDATTVITFPVNFRYTYFTI